PSGTTLTPGAQLTLKYNTELSTLPPQTTEEQLNIAVAYYDDTQQRWIPLPTTLDRANKKATATITHFTLFATVDLSAVQQQAQPAPSGQGDLKATIKGPKQGKAEDNLEYTATATYKDTQGNNKPINKLEVWASDENPTKQIDCKSRKEGKWCLLQEFTNPANEKKLNWKPETEGTYAIIANAIAQDKKCSGEPRGQADWEYCGTESYISVKIEPKQGTQPSQPAQPATPPAQPPTQGPEHLATLQALLKGNPKETELINCCKDKAAVYPDIRTKNGRQCEIVVCSKESPKGRQYYWAYTGYEYRNGQRAENKAACTGTSNNEKYFLPSACSPAQPATPPSQPPGQPVPTEPCQGKRDGTYCLQPKGAAYFTCEAGKTKSKANCGEKQNQGNICVQHRSPHEQDSKLITITCENPEQKMCSSESDIGNCREEGRHCSWCAKYEDKTSKSSPYFWLKTTQCAEKAQCSCQDEKQVCKEEGKQDIPIQYSECTGQAGKERCSSIWTNYIIRCFADSYGKVVKVCSGTCKDGRCEEAQPPGKPTRIIASLYKNDNTGTTKISKQQCSPTDTEAPEIKITEPTSTKNEWECRPDRGEGYFFITTTTGKRRLTLTPPSGFKCDEPRYITWEAEHIGTTKTDKGGGCEANIEIPEGDLKIHLKYYLSPQTTAPGPATPPPPPPPAPKACSLNQALDYQKPKYVDIKGKENCAAAEYTCSDCTSPEDCKKLYEQSLANDKDKLKKLIEGTSEKAYITAPETECGNTCQPQKQISRKCEASCASDRKETKDLTCGTDSKRKCCEVILDATNNCIYKGKYHDPEAQPTPTICEPAVESKPPLPPIIRYHYYQKKECAYHPGYLGGWLGGWGRGYYWQDKGRCDEGDCLCNIEIKQSGSTGRSCSSKDTKTKETVSIKGYTHCEDACQSKAEQLVSKYTNCEVKVASVEFPPQG
ncbi:hypothetical protein HY640_02450, partial [Candidatus Woesearchaeota archaeon]|nr:hypothetical protein [Candidatus Woesearchaeota archaeon]